MSAAVLLRALRPTQLASSGLLGNSEYGLLWLLIHCHLGEILYMGVTRGREV